MGPAQAWLRAWHHTALSACQTTNMYTRIIEETVWLNQSSLGVMEGGVTCPLETQEGSMVVETEGRCTRPADFQVERCRNRFLPASPEGCFLEDLQIALLALAHRSGHHPGFPGFIFFASTLASSLANLISWNCVQLSPFLPTITLLLCQSSSWHKCGIRGRPSRAHCCESEH